MNSSGIPTFAAGKPAVMARRILSVADLTSIAVLLSLAVLSWLPHWRGPIDLRWDAGAYYVLGTSLAEGRGYRLLNEPGDIQAMQYPPLTSVLIAMHQRLAGTSDPFTAGVLLKATWFLMFAGTIALTYAMLKRFFPAGWAFFGGLLCVFSFPLYFHAGVCTAELPFALASVAFLLAYHPNARVRREIMAALAAVAAYFARTIGITLFAAWILDALIRRQWRRGIFRAAVSLSSVLVWQGYIKSVEHSPEYHNPAYPYQRAPYQFHNVSYGTNLALKNPFRPELGSAGNADFAARFISNVRVLPAALGEALTSNRGFWEMQANALANQLGGAHAPLLLVGPVLLLLGSLVLLGTGLRLIRGDFLPGLYVCTTLFAVCSTPWPEQLVRYLTPILPVLLLAFFTAIHFPVKAARTATFRRAWQLAGAFILAGVLVHNSLTYYQAIRYSSDFATVSDQSGRFLQYKQLYFSAGDAALDEAADWIRARAKASDVVSVFLPHWVFLRTGLKTVMPPLEKDAARADELLASVPIRYMIFENTNTAINFARPYIREVIETFPNRWRLVFTSRGDLIRVYQRTVP